MHRFDLRAQVWEAVPARGDMPNGRSAGTAAVVSRRWGGGTVETMYLFGGRIQSSGRTRVMTNDLHEFDFETATWTKVVLSAQQPPQQPPPARTDHVMVEHGGDLWVFGGFDEPILGR